LSNHIKQAIILIQHFWLSSQDLLVGRHHLDVANVDRSSIMLEYVALDTMYFIVIEPILMFFYESHQKSDGILRGSLVKYVTILSSCYVITR
jgi:hypothetical protein